MVGCLALSVLVSDAAGCDVANMSTSSAIRSLYGDSDAVQYVCGEVQCTLAAFTRGLAVEGRKLGIGGTGDDALLIEPARKANQYFSALYLVDRKACAYRLVFAPDVSASGIKLLKSLHHGYVDIRSHQRESAAYWRDDDFLYDPRRFRYVSIKSRCFADLNGATETVPCE